MLRWWPPSLLSPVFFNLQCFILKPFLSIVTQMSMPNIHIRFTGTPFAYKNVDIRVNYTKAIVLCRDQIICSAMSEGGDSGSVILDKNNNIVGLLFAGSSQFTIVNPIQRVLKELDVNILH